ncbi:YqfQ family protein [Bacillus sp. CECT 9360]|uniref:YqfQ family protein n=1 Tax=Bacillus sp. CECT 9360 TaxID=2845821 RepID=UPI001E5F0FAD|nr:YqfQ family protein [Bacillus sp. CECT 9360]
MQHQPAAGGGTQQKGVGGLISKILGKSKQQSPPPSSYFSRPSAPVEPIKSTASLTSVLANTQKVLSAAEQIGPMVHQYGPIIKNLPAMWKMYRSMKDTENTEEAEDENTETTEEKLAEPVETEVKTVVKEEKSSHLEIKDEQIVPKTKKRERISQPKLYI